MDIRCTITDDLCLLLTPCTGSLIHDMSRSDLSTSCITHETLPDEYDEMFAQFGTVLYPLDIDQSMAALHDTPDLSALNYDGSVRVIIDTPLLCDELQYGDDAVIPIDSVDVTSIAELVETATAYITRSPLLRDASRFCALQGLFRLLAHSHDSNDVSSSDASNSSKRELLQTINTLMSHGELHEDICSILC